MDYIMRFFSVIKKPFMTKFGYLSKDILWPKDDLYILPSFESLFVCSDELKDMNTYEMPFSWSFLPKKTTFLTHFHIRCLNLMLQMLSKK